MNEEEAFFRKQLRRLRTLATMLGGSYQDDQIMFSRWPETQALAIMEEPSVYQLAAMMLVNSSLAPGELKKMKYLPSTGLPATEQEIFKDLCQLQAKRLKEKFDPLEVYRQVVMPWVRTDLETLECHMVEQGYRLPKWERPPWLTQREGES